MFAFNKAKVKMRHRGRVMTWRQEARSCKGDYPLLLHDYSQTRKWGETKDNKKKKKRCWASLSSRRLVPGNTPAVAGSFGPLLSGGFFEPKRMSKGTFGNLPSLQDEWLGGKKNKTKQTPSDPSQPSSFRSQDQVWAVCCPPAPSPEYHPIIFHQCWSIIWCYKPPWRRFFPPSMYRRKDWTCIDLPEIRKINWVFRLSASLTDWIEAFDSDCVTICVFI